MCGLVAGSGGGGPPGETVSQGLWRSIQRGEQLLYEPFDEIEYAQVRLVREKANGAEVRVHGRIVSRAETFITLRRNGHTHEVELKQNDWTVTDWAPVVSSIERQQIEAEWAE